MNGHELAAPYVLDQLESDELAAFERALANDPQLQEEVESMRSLADLLGELPAEAWPQEEVAITPRPALPQAAWWRRPVLAAASLLIALAIGAGIGNALSGGGGSGGSAPVLSLHSLGGDSAAHGTVSMPREDEMELSVAGLPDLGAGRYYEVWLMSSPEDTVPLASFRVDSGGTATVRIPLPVAPQDFRYFDVSLQSTAGGTAHSSDSVLRGPTKPS
jgi:anti-sigma-K factor RskA